ncbi:hypothetical protein JAAARDRAFT_194302 [Jaapia argillacea MUCL 33604]|uniref:Cytochrome P450 n=1 Tax=Jaapia argillacea MUCL 33604 TaxID=933084 RepID=A0A067PQN3_9AGAM|nr:hypothetical protein JAAARDRAFT_194302 [Jaapia argillacea MUCL 33604]
MLSSLTIQLFLICLFAAFCKIFISWTQRKRYPPGPTPIPFIGNALDLRTGASWLKYIEWQKKYGDIVHFTVFGVHIVVLNSMEVAHDLFEKRSQIYSSRPQVPTVNRLAGTIILKATYDYDVEPKNDLFYLPEWLPGMGFQAKYRRCVTLTREIKIAPISLVKTRLQATGKISHSVASDLLGNMNPDGNVDEEEDAIKGVSGADTTVSAVTTGILAMTLYPETLKRAQREIDAVIGRERLPDFNDRDALPYVEAFTREILRWRPILALLPHATSEDDVYEGYYIPKGTMVLANAWAILHDEKIYDAPEDFMPERYLNSDGSINDDYPSLAFGLGRRICPGRSFADAEIWIAIVSIMAVFDVTKAKDDNGSDIHVTADYSIGSISHPLPFKCHIQPRSEVAPRLIQDTGN